VSVSVKPLNNKLVSWVR